MRYLSVTLICAVSFVVQGCSRQGDGQETADPKAVVAQDQNKDPKKAPSDADLLKNSKHPEADGMTIHRTLAGEPDASGWYPARSTGGRFSVRLPAPFMDSSMASSERLGVLTHVYMLAASYKHQSRFMITGVKRVDGKPLAKDLEELTDLLAVGAPAGQRRSVPRKGITGLEFKVANRSWGVTNRTFEARGMGYIMMAEYPVRVGEEAFKTDIERFFNSFELPDGPPRAP
ncbi:MAG: hypothetical protein L0Z62_07690 [Gemmataceae bacterium]|nr:hypothetical protein [Gemmataceae bacterium]